MFCAISGEAPKAPVVSLKSGNVFERSLIEKYIAENGKDPVNNEEMTVDDLIEVKSIPETVRPRPPTLASVPSLLSVFQNEWDSLMLETFKLRQQYEQVRQELSHALYQADAATRVIARMKKERDSAREALANIQEHLGTAAPAAPAASTEEAMDVDTRVLPEVVDAKIVAVGDELRQERRSKKKPPVEFASIDAVKSYTCTSSISSLHAARPAGITALDVNSSGNLILTGGADKHVQIHDKTQDKIVAKLTGHTKKITSVKFRGQSVENDVIISSSADKHIRVWSTDADDNNGYKVAHNIGAHKNEVTDISVHPSKDYFVSSSLDSKWSFYDFESATPLLEQASDANEVQGYTKVAFHPDGMILGAGTSSSVVQMWDVRSQEKAATFSGHTGKVTALAFSENGYILAVASEDNLVKIWDLRKQANTKTFTLKDDFKVNTLSFDNWGQYLAVGGSSVCVLKAKDGSNIVNFEDNTGEITGLHWNPLAHGLISSSLDRTVRFYDASA